VNQSIPAIKNLEATDSPIVLKGKVILVSWDSRFNGSYDYNFWVPENLTTLDTDKKITVLLMGDKKYEKVGTWIYEKDGREIPGCVVTTKIYAVYWPERQMAGVAHVRGSEPNEYEMRNAFSTNECEFPKGNMIEVWGIAGDRGITQWISGLPHQS
jgi:hypothetical protein